MTVTAGLTSVTEITVTFIAFHAAILTDQCAIRTAKAILTLVACVTVPTGLMALRTGGLSVAVAAIPAIFTKSVITFRTDRSAILTDAYTIFTFKAIMTLVFRPAI